jgi:GNAT superfamily N-acetyltransferase
MGEYDLRDLAPGDPGWVISRHGALYWRDESYDMRFEALVARVVARFLADRDPATERGWIAWTAGGARAGCIFCTRPDREAAQLRLFLVEPEHRGTGLAPQLLGACIRFARDTGATRLQLRTHESHRAAGRLYARSGFELIGTKPVEAFGQPTAEQHWQLAL